MKEKHGWIYRIVTWILGLFGHHLAKNPPKGRKGKGTQKTLPTLDSPAERGCLVGSLGGMVGITGDQYQNRGRITTNKEGENYGREKRIREIEGV